MKKFGKILMILAIAAVFIGTFAYLFRRSQPKEIQYQELVPETGSISKSTVVTGKIQPRDEVNVKPQINGIVAELYKKAGETVQQNEVIAKLKVIPDMSQLSSAQSRLRLSEMNLEQAQINYDREKALSQAPLGIVRDGVSSSNKSGSTTLVRSTISGLILDIPVKVGNSVTMSNTFNDGTTIATVANMDDLIFDGNIDETEVGRLHVGLPVRISVGALQDVHFDAALEYIAPKATESGGTNLFEIKASVKIPAGITIRSGYSANAEIVLQEAHDVVTVAESAIQWEGDSTFVYVMDGETWSRRAVETGLSDGVNIEVRSGLAAGEKVRGPQIITNTK